MHTFATAHFGHVPPPQSTSVSLAFLIASLQVGPAAMSTPPSVKPPLHTLLVQVPPAQSVPIKHIFPSAHVGHVPPPQSTSVSLPSLFPSVHCGAAQSPLVHVSDAQSRLRLHILPI